MLFSKAKRQGQLIITIPQSQKILEPAIRLNTSQDRKILPSEVIQKIFSSLHVTLMVYYHPYQVLIPSKPCTILYQDILPRWQVQKWVLRSPRPHSQPVLVKHSCPFILHFTLKCWPRRFRNSAQRYG
jgi:hypothetical protein